MAAFPLAMTVNNNRPYQHYCQDQHYHYNNDNNSTHHEDYSSKSPQLSTSIQVTSSYSNLNSQSTTTPHYTNCTTNGISQHDIDNNNQHHQHQMNVIPFPPYMDFSSEPSFIRKRNERERIRVRHVNEGYAKLRDHLPREFNQKRLSKVETLRAAIRYIRYLEELLKQGDSQCTDCKNDSPTTS